MFNASIFFPITFNPKASSDDAALELIFFNILMNQIDFSFRYFRKIKLYLCTRLTLLLYYCSEGPPLCMLQEREIPHLLISYVRPILHCVSCCLISNRPLWDAPSHWSSSGIIWWSTRYGSRIHVPRTLIKLQRKRGINLFSDNQITATSLAALWFGGQDQRPTVGISNSFLPIDKNPKKWISKFNLSVQLILYWMDCHWPVRWPTRR